MSITCQLKQVSTSTLEIITENPLLLNSFFDAKWLPESDFWQQRKWVGEAAEKTKQEAGLRFTRSVRDPLLKQQLLPEWEIPELDLHKYFRELTYLLAGYIPGYLSSEWTVPELKSLASLHRQKDFLPFIVTENSAWDELPIVNAIGAGTEIGTEGGYGKARYLLPDEVGEILDGLLFLSEEGFQERYKRESEKAKPLPWIEWSEEEMLDWLTDYFNEIQNYYEDTYRQKAAMLIYLT